MKTVLAIFGGLVGLVLILALPFAMGGYGLVFQRVFGVANANVNTDITRQSNQYITTQQQALSQKLEDWKRVDAQAATVADPAPLRAQQAAIVSSMRTVTVTLAPDRVPADVRAFLATH